MENCLICNRASNLWQFPINSADFRAHSHGHETARSATSVDSVFEFPVCTSKEKLSRNLSPHNRQSPTTTSVQPDSPNICLARSTQLSTLLLRHTDSPTPTAGGFRVLATHAQAPEVSQATMGADLLQSLQVLAELAVHVIRQDLGVLAVHNIALSVQEPGGDLVLSRVLDDGDDALEFFGSDVTGAVMGVDELARGLDFLFRGVYRLLRSTSGRLAACFLY